MGVSHEPGLPFASSLCGACGEVCPVKIDIPKILLELRSDVKKAESAREAEPAREAGLPRLRLADDASAPVRNGRPHGAPRSRPPADGEMDPQRARADERRAGEGVAEPARPAAAARQELPRDVEAALMSRENILHRIRTALGRSAGQPVADPPPVRLRVPEVDMEARIASMLHARGGAGRARPPRTDDPRAFVARGDRRQDRGGVECAVSCGVRHHGAARRALRHHRSRGTARRSAPPSTSGSPAPITRWPTPARW